MFAVSLVRPQISAPAGEVTWGQSLGITCSISTQHTGGSFTLKKGSFTEMKSTSENSVTFTIHHADFSHEGSYYCQYQTTVSNRKFTSPQSNTISVSVVGMDTNVCSMSDAYLISASQMTLYVYTLQHMILYLSDLQYHVRFVLSPTLCRSLI